MHVTQVINKAINYKGLVSHFAVNIKGGQFPLYQVAPHPKFGGYYIEQNQTLLSAPKEKPVWPCN